jgi:signal peptidase I
MDVEPGQSRVTGESSAEPADHAAREAVNGSRANGGIGQDGDPASAGGPQRPGQGPRDAGAPDAGDNGSPVDNGSAGGKGSADGKDGAEAEGEQPEDGDEEASGASGSSAGSKRKRSFWRELFVIVVAALVLTVLIKAFLVQVFSIPSASMENTLQVGDRILVNRLVYHLRDISRGDVVVFSGDGSWGPEPPPPPSNPVVRFWDDITSLVGVSVPGTDYVKRVVGVPGDQVACCDKQGRVTVNGVPLSEGSYIYPGDQPSLLKFSLKVPPGRLFVLGDHRSDSADSRYHGTDPGNGTVPESAVVGRAFVIIWPPSRIGDIPIPETFKQPAINATTAAVNLAPAVTGGGAAAGVLAWRRRRAARDGRAERGD